MRHCNRWIELTSVAYDAAQKGKCYMYIMEYLNTVQRNSVQILRGDQYNYLS